MIYSFNRVFRFKETSCESLDLNSHRLTPAVLSSSYGPFLNLDCPYFPFCLSNSLSEFVLPTNPRQPPPLIPVVVIFVPRSSDLIHSLETANPVSLTTTLGSYHRLYHDHQKKKIKMCNRVKSVLHDVLRCPFLGTESLQFLTDVRVSIITTLCSLFYSFNNGRTINYY